MLVAEADRKREAEGLTHQQFAESLGIKKALWSLTRSGKKPLRRKVASAIVRRYPDLRAIAVKEIASYTLDETTTGQ